MRALSYAAEAAIDMPWSLLERTRTEFAYATPIYTDSYIDINQSLLECSVPLEGTEPGRYYRVIMIHSS
jgi:hypothetical protein